VNFERERVKDKIIELLNVTCERGASENEATEIHRTSALAACSVAHDSPVPNHYSGEGANGEHSACSDP
jgi:hypothetical protein